VVVEALDLLRRESELRALIQEGMDACDRGEVIDGEVVFEHIRQRARANSERG
jgi:predicted transcriptional regulator